jgi:hypothetical protein
LKGRGRYLMELISQYLPGGTEENNERIQSEYAVS